MMAIADEHGEELSEEDVFEIFKKIDPAFNGDRISYDSFLKFNMRGKFNEEEWLYILNIIFKHI